MSERLYLNDDNENKYYSPFNISYYINEYEKINKQKNLYSKNDLAQGRMNTNFSLKTIENENTTGYQRNKEFDQEKFNQSKPKDNSELNMLKSNIEDSISSQCFDYLNLSCEYNSFGKNNDSSLINYMKDLENQNDKKEKNCLFDVQNTVDNETSLNAQEISVGLEEKKTNNLIPIYQHNSSKFLELKNENNNSKLKEKLSQQKDDSFLIKSDKYYSNKSINLNTSWPSCVRIKNNIYNFFQSKPQVPYNKELLFQHDLQNTSLGLNKKSSGLSKENLEVSRDLHKPLVNPKSNNNESNKLLGKKRNKPNEEPKKIFTIKNSRNKKAFQNNKKEKKEQLNDLDSFDNISEININDSEDHLNNPEIFPIVQELGTNKKGNENKINIDNDFNVDIPLRENNAITSIKHYVVKMFIDEINEKIAVKDKTKQLYVTKFAKSINRNKNIESFPKKWKDILLINYKDEEKNENNLENELKNNQETIKYIYDNKENFEDAYNLLEKTFDEYYDDFLNNNLEEFLLKGKEKQLADFKQKKYKTIIKKLIQDKKNDALNIIRNNYTSFISLNKEGEKKNKTKPLSIKDLFLYYSYTINKQEKFQDYVKTIYKSLNFEFKYEKEKIEKNIKLFKKLAKEYKDWFIKKIPRKRK